MKILDALKRLFNSPAEDSPSPAGRSSPSAYVPTPPAIRPFVATLVKCIQVGDFVVGNAVYNDFFKKKEEARFSLSTDLDVCVRFGYEYDSEYKQQIYNCCEVFVAGSEEGLSDAESQALLAAYTDYNKRLRDEQDSKKRNQRSAALEGIAAYTPTPHTPEEQYVEYILRKQKCSNSPSEKTTSSTNSNEQTNR